MNRIEQANPRPLPTAATNPMSTVQRHLRDGEIDKGLRLVDQRLRALRDNTVRRTYLGRLIKLADDPRLSPQKRLELLAGLDRLSSWITAQEKSEARAAKELARHEVTLRRWAQGATAEQLGVTITSKGKDALRVLGQISALGLSGGRRSRLPTLRRAAWFSFTNLLAKRVGSKVATAQRRVRALRASARKRQQVWVALETPQARQQLLCSLGVGRREARQLARAPRVDDAALQRALERADKALDRTYQRINHLDPHRFKRDGLELMRFFGAEARALANELSVRPGSVVDDAIQTNLRAGRREVFEDKAMGVAATILASKLQAPGIASLVFGARDLLSVSGDVQVARASEALGLAKKGSTAAAQKRVRAMKNKVAKDVATGVASRGAKAVAHEVSKVAEEVVHLGHEIHHLHGLK